MSLFAATLEALTILFFVGTIGFLAVKRGLIARDVLTALSRVALEIALPALIFTNLITQEMPDDGAPAWTLPLWWMAFMAVVAALACLVSIFVPKEVRREFRAALIYPNAVFIPLLLLGTKYGQNSPEVAMLFVFNLFFSPYYFTTYPIYFGSRKLSEIRWTRVVHPVLIITLLALIIRACGLRETIPFPILQGTEMLGKAALPLILLILGGQLTANAKKTKTNHGAWIVVFVIVKNIVFPAFFITAAIVFQLPRIVTIFIVIQSAMPPITSLPIVAERAGADHSFTARLMLASFIAAAVTIPLAITFLAE